MSRGAFAAEPKRRVHVPPTETQEAERAPEESAGSLHELEDRMGMVQQQSPSPPVQAERVQAQPQQSDGATVLEGSLLGDFSVEEYTQAVVNGIHDAMGEVDLLTAGCALDQAIGEFLTIAQDAAGPKVAQEFSTRFCQTALPFVQQQLYNTVKYKELAGKKSGSR